MHTQTATIRVMEPCDCSLTWWQCHREHNRAIVAEYHCDGIDDGPAPTLASIHWVCEEHPGMTLVYLT